MARSFNWGIIGAGGIARAFARDVQRLEDHRIFAVGSRALESARAFAANVPGCIPVESYEALVSTPEIDAVYVATPHPSHHSNTLLALRAGKPVLCEKPFAVTAQQATEMISTARENNLALMEGMWSRFLPHMRQARELVSTGVLGEILSVEADHGQRLSPRKIPRLVQPELAGGALMDLGIYPVSLAHEFLGVPESIVASALFTSEGVDSQTSAIFTYSSGAQAILNANMDTETPCRAVINGAVARLEIDTVFYRPTTMRLVDSKGEATYFPNTYEGMGLREEAAEFARIVRAGEIESPIIPHSQIVEIMESMDQIREIIDLSFPFE